MTEGLQWGYYFDHVLSWWPHRNNPNMLVLKYEDMIKDLESAVSKIATFLNVELSTDITNKIVRLSSFDTMKKDKTATCLWEEKEDTKSLLRKGIVGDWKNYLSPEQSAQMDMLCDTKLEGTGLEFDFE